MPNRQNQSGLFGVSTGLLPVNGPKILQVPVDLTSGSVVLDLHEEVSMDAMEFIQSVYLDNSSGGAILSLLVSVTQHNIVCPTKGQGVFAVNMVPGASQIKVSGPALKYNFLFSNMPNAPSVWIAQ